MYCLIMCGLLVDYCNSLVCYLRIQVVWDHLHWSKIFANKTAICVVKYTSLAKRSASGQTGTDRAPLSRLNHVRYPRSAPACCLNQLEEPFGFWWARKVVGTQCWWSWLSLRAVMHDGSLRFSSLQGLLNFSGPILPCWYPLMTGLKKKAFLYLILLAYLSGLTKWGYFRGYFQVQITSTDKKFVSCTDLQRWIFSRIFWEHNSFKHWHSDAKKAGSREISFTTGFLGNTIC